MKHNGLKRLLCIILAATILSTNLNIPALATEYSQVLDGDDAAGEASDTGTTEWEAAPEDESQADDILDSETAETEADKALHSESEDSETTDPEDETADAEDETTDASSERSEAKIENDSEITAREPVDFSAAYKKITKLEIKESWYLQEAENEEDEEAEKITLEPEILTDEEGTLKTYDLTDLEEDQTVYFSIDFACKSDEKNPIRKGDYFTVTFPEEFADIQFSEEQYEEQYTEEELSELEPEELREAGIETEFYRAALTPQEDGSIELLVTMKQDVVTETEGELELYFNIATFAKDSDTGEGRFFLKEEEEQEDVVTYSFLKKKETAEEEEEKQQEEEEKKEETKAEETKAEETEEEENRAEEKELSGEESALVVAEMAPEEGVVAETRKNEEVTGDTRTFDFDGSVAFNEVADNVDWKDLLRPDVFGEPIKITQYYMDGTKDDNGENVIKTIENYAQDSQPTGEFYLKFTNDGNGGGSFTIKKMPYAVTVEGKQYQVINYVISAKPRYDYYKSDDIQLLFDNSGYVAETDKTIDLSINTETLTLAPGIMPEDSEDNAEFKMTVTYTNNANEGKTEAIDYKPTNKNHTDIQVPVGLKYSVTQAQSAGYKFDGYYTTIIKEGETETRSKTEVPNTPASGEIKAGKDVTISTVNYVQNLAHEFEVQWVDNNSLQRPALIDNGATAFFDLQFRRKGSSDEWVTVTADETNTVTIDGTKKMQVLDYLGLATMPEIEMVTTNGGYTTYQFKGLPALNVNEEEIVFRVVLNGTNFYNKDSVTKNYTAEEKTSESDGKKKFILTEHTEYSATISWKDGDNEALGATGKIKSVDENGSEVTTDTNDTTPRPKNIDALNLKLYRRVGSGIYEEVFPKENLSKYVTIKKDSDNNDLNTWEVNITDLPRYDTSNNEYDYVLVQGTFDGSGNLTAKETKPNVDVVDDSTVGYKTYYNNGTGRYGNDFTVCHNGGTISEKLVTSQDFTAWKKWKDSKSSNEIEESRPQGTVTLWRFVKHQVEEAMGDSTEDMLDYAFQNGFAAQVVYHVTNNGNIEEQVVSCELDRTTEQEIKFNNLPADFKFPGNDDQGRRYVYFVRETLTGDNSDNYDITYTDKDGKIHKEGTYTDGLITNTRREKASVNVTKIWKAAREMSNIANTEVQLEIWAKTQEDGAKYEKLQVYSEEQGSYDILTDSENSSDHPLRDAQTASGFSESIAMGETSYYVNIYNSEGLPYDMSTAKIREIIRNTNSGETLATVELDASFSLFGKSYTPKTELNKSADNQIYTLLADGTKQYRYTQTNTISEQMYFEFLKAWDPSIEQNDYNDIQGIVMTLYCTSSNDLENPNVIPVGKYIMPRAQATLDAKNITEQNGEPIGNNYTILTVENAKSPTNKTVTENGVETTKQIYYWDYQSGVNLPLYDKDGYLYEYTARETGFVIGNKITNDVSREDKNWSQDYRDFQIFKSGSSDIEGQGTRITNYKYVGRDPYFTISKKWYDFGDNKANRQDVYVRIYNRATLKEALSSSASTVDANTTVKLDDLKKDGSIIPYHQVIISEQGTDVYDEEVYFNDLKFLGTESTQLENYVLLEYKIGDNGSPAEYTYSQLWAVANVDKNNSTYSHYTIKGEVESANLYEVTNVLKENTIQGSHQSFEIINRRTGVVTISGGKVWEDENNHIKSRPSSIQFQLYQDGEAYKPGDHSPITCTGNDNSNYTASIDTNTGIVTVSVVDGSTNTETSWGFTITNLPMYNSIGYLHTYNMEEVTQTTNGSVRYLQRVVGTISNQDSKKQTYNFTYTNTVIGTVDHIAYKVWRDEAIGSDHRPDLYLTLYRYLDKDKDIVQAAINSGMTLADLEGKTLTQLQNELNSNSTSNLIQNLLTLIQNAISTVTGTTSNEDTRVVVTKVTDGKDQIWTAAKDQATEEADPAKKNYLARSEYNWKICVPDLPEFDNHGQEYVYVFTEKMNHDGETIMGNYIASSKTLTYPSSATQADDAITYEVFTNTISDYMTVTGKKTWTGLSNYNLNTEELPDPVILLYRITESNAEKYYKDTGKSVTNLQQYSEKEFFELLKDINKSTPSGFKYEEAMTDNKKYELYKQFLRTTNADSDTLIYVDNTYLSGTGKTQYSLPRTTENNVAVDEVSGITKLVDGTMMLPKFNENGERYLYLVREMIEDPIASQLYTEENSNGTLSNVFRTDLNRRSITVTKSWNRTEEYNGYPYPSVNFQLYRYELGKETTTTEKIKEHRINATEFEDGKETSYTFSDLLIYSPTGAQYGYYIIEDLIDGYTCTVEDEDFIKNWPNVGENVAKKYSIGLQNDRHVKYEDFTDQMINGLKNNTVTIDGKEYARIDVVSLPNDWNKVESISNTEVKATNTYNKKGSITVEGDKNWEDYFNADQLRNPGNTKKMGEVVKIKLSRYTTNEPGQTNAYCSDTTSQQVDLLVISDVSNLTDDQKDKPYIIWSCDGTDYNTAAQWKYEIHNLDCFAPNGQPYYYIIAENKLDNYAQATSVKIIANNTSSASSVVQADALTNAYTTECSLVKNWYDGNNKYNLRPENVTIYLQRKRKNDPTAEWEFVPATAPESTHSGNADSQTGTTNNPPSVDKENSKRVSIYLTADNVVERTNGNTWAYTFKNLPDTHYYRCIETEIGGVPVNREDGKSEYAGGAYICEESTDSNTNKTVISNTLDSTTLEVTKNWNGDQVDLYHTRPDAVTFTLQKRRKSTQQLADGSDPKWSAWEDVILSNGNTYTFEVTKEEGWKKTLDELPLVDVEVVTDTTTNVKTTNTYTLQFRAVETHKKDSLGGIIKDLLGNPITSGAANYIDDTDYKATSRVHYHEGTLNKSIVTNELRTEGKSIKVTKQWNRTSGAEVSATFELLYAEKQSLGETILNWFGLGNEIEWHYFGDPALVGGEGNASTVFDKETADYSKHTEANGCLVKTSTSTGSKLEEVYTWENLPKYDASGNELIYTVIEHPLDGFKTEVEGPAKVSVGGDYKFTNTELQDYTVSKVWQKTTDGPTDANGNYTATFKLQQYAVPKAVKADQSAGAGNGKRTVDESQKEINVYYESNKTSENIKNDFSSYLAALHASGVTSIEYAGKTYTWNGSQWVIPDTLVSNVATQLAASIASHSGDSVNVTMEFGRESYTFKFSVVNQTDYNNTVTTDSKVVRADWYVYPNDKPYTYVGKRVVNANEKTITVYYRSSDLFITENQMTDNLMNDFARYLGALYESGVTSIKYGDYTYTWEDNFQLQGSNWAADTDGDGIREKTLVSAVTEYANTHQSDTNISLTWDGETYTYSYVRNDKNYENITPTASTTIPAVVKADHYVYPVTAQYSYVGKRVVDASAKSINAYYTSGNLGNSTSSDPVQRYANVLNDLARYLGALYRATHENGATGIDTITFNGVNYTWDANGTLKGSNWVNPNPKTLVSNLDVNGNTGSITLKWDNKEYTYSYSKDDISYSTATATAGQDSSSYTDVEGATVYTITSAKSDTSAKWENLPKYTDAGEEIIYRAVETQINGINVVNDTNGQYVVTYEYDKEDTAKTDKTVSTFGGTTTTATNRMVYGFVNLSKAAAYLAPDITANGDKLEGVTFDIYRGNEKYIEGIETKDDGTLTYNADGTYGTGARYLVAGTYTIREASVGSNDNYSVWDKGITFTVGTESGTTGEHGTAWITTKTTWTDHFTNGIHLDVEYLSPADVNGDAKSSHYYPDGEGHTDGCIPQTNPKTVPNGTTTPDPAYNIESRGVIAFTKTGPDGEELDTHEGNSGESQAYFGVYTDQACTQQVAGMVASDLKNFKLTNQNQDNAGTLVTINNTAGLPYLRSYGSGEFTLLSGVYYVKELVAPPGYKLDKTVRKATINYLTNTAVDTNLNTVYTDNIASIEGLTDRKWHNDKNVVTLYKMDQYGRNVTLKEGEYLKLSVGVGSGTFKTGENTIYLYQDVDKPATKTDKTTLVSGIQYDGNDKVWTISGLFDIGKTYTLSEPPEAVPADNMQAADITFTMTADGTLESVTGANSHTDPTTVTGNDYDSYYSASVAENVIVMRDKARYLTDVKIDKKEKGSENKLLPNISFTLYKFDSVTENADGSKTYSGLKNVLGKKSGNTIVADDSLFLTTDSEGKILISEQAGDIYNTVTGCQLKFGLDIGKYYFEEIERGASDSYRLVGKVFFEIMSDDQAFDSTAQVHNGAKVIFDTSSDNVKQEDNSKAAAVYNDPVTSVQKTLQLTKVDAGNNETKLANARFTLKYTSITNGQSGSANEVSYNCVTDSNGALFLADNGWTITTNQPDISCKGTYVLTEVQAPENYITPQKSNQWLNTIVFTVDSDNMITVNSNASSSAFTITETTGNSTVSYPVVSKYHTTLTVKEKNNKTVISIAKRNDIETNNEVSNTKTKDQKSLNGEKLAGATLQIFEGTDTSGTKIEEWTIVDKEGVIDDHTVQAGKLKENTIYTLHESATPDGYLTADDIYFYIYGTTNDNATESQVYVWKGTGTPDLANTAGWDTSTNVNNTVLTMVDEAVIAPVDMQKVVGDSTYAVLPGARFDVKEGSTKLGEAISDQDGYLVWESITETGYDSGRIYNAAGKRITAGDATTVIGSSIILQKNGSGYTFTETYAPDHAYKKGESKTVKITDYDYLAYKNSNGYYTTKYVNILRTQDSTQETTNPLSERTSDDKSATDSDLVNPAFKATFRIYKYDVEHKDINAAHDNYNSIGMAGVKFTLYRKNADEKYEIVGSEGKYVTTANGLLSINIDKKGDYKLKEYETLTGYELSNTELTFKIVNSDYNKTLTYLKTKNNHTTEVETGTNTDNTYGLSNNRKHGSVTLTKQDANNADIKLDGVKYKLTRTNPSTPNSLVDHYFPSSTVTSYVVETGKTYGNIAGATAEGNITKKDGIAGVLTLNDLQWGTYTLTEIQENEGYVLEDSGDKILEFTIGADNADTTQTLKDKDKDAVLNSKNQLTIKKAAMDGTTLLNGAKFKLFKVTKDGADDKINTSSPASFYTNSGDSTIATNKEFTVTDGTLTIYGISKGTYVLRETHAPDGYELAGDVKFTMNERGVVLGVSACQVDSGTGVVTSDNDESFWTHNGTTLTVKDQPIEVSLKKVDADVDAQDQNNSGLAGAVYEITPVQECRFAEKALASIPEQSGTSTESATKQTENGTTTVTTVASAAETGIIEIPAGLLVAGQSYVIHEATAPDSYELGEDVTISVGTDGTIEVIDEVTDGTGTGTAVTLDQDGAENTNGTTVGLKLKDEPIEVTLQKIFEGAGEMTTKPAGAVFKITPATESAFARTTVGQDATTKGYRDPNITNAEFPVTPNVAYVKVTTATDATSQDTIGTGRILIPEGLLKQGNSYILKEVQTADGYQLYSDDSSKNQITFTVGTDGTVTFVEKKDAKYTEFKGSSTEQTPSDTIRVTNKQTKLSIKKKVDDTTSEYDLTNSNMEFTLKKVTVGQDFKPTNGSIVGQSWKPVFSSSQKLLSDEQVFQGLAAGWYKLEESIVPNGYQKADDIYFKLDQDNKVTHYKLVNGVLTEDTDTVNNPICLSSEGSNCYLITMDNKLIRGHVQLTKVFIDTKTKVQDAVFSLYKKQGTNAILIAEGLRTNNSEGLWTTVNDKTLVMQGAKSLLSEGNDAPKLKDGLTVGEYYLVETGCDSAYLNPETDKPKYTFSITDSTTVILDGDNNDGNGKLISNTPYTSTFTLWKTEDAAHSFGNVSGATFKIYYKGTYDTTYTEIAEKTTGKVNDVGEDGKFTYTVDKKGSYLLKEVSNPGYEISECYYKFELDDTDYSITRYLKETSDSKSENDSFKLSDGTTVTDVTNVPVKTLEVSESDFTEPEEGIENSRKAVKLQITKVDKEKDSKGDPIPLEGVEFAVYKADDIESNGQPKEGSNSVVDSNGDSQILTTNNNGIVTFEGLDWDDYYGKYVIVETNAIAGYHTRSNISVTIIRPQDDSDTPVQYITADKAANEKMKLVINKTSVENNENKPLSGAVFAICYAKDVKVNNDGTYSIEVDTATNKEKVLQSGLITGTDGTVTLQGLLAGDQNYALVETTPPAGYKVSRPVYFHVSKEGVISGINDKKNSTDFSAEISSASEFEPDGDYNPAHYNTITVKDKKINITLIKKDKENDGILQGAEFTVKGEFVNGNTDITGVIVGGTNANVTNKLKGQLIAGKIYTFTETTAPKGYMLMADVKVKIDIYGRLEVVENNDATAINPSGPTSDDNTRSTVYSGNASLTLKDTPIAITITKNNWDENFTAITGNPATYELTPVSASGTSTDSGFAMTVKALQTLLGENNSQIEITPKASDSNESTPISKLTLRTNEDGSVSIPHALLIAENQYALRETVAPEGYELASYALKFTVNKNGTLTLNYPDDAKNDEDKEAAYKKEYDLYSDSADTIRAGTHINAQDRPIEIKINKEDLVNSTLDNKIQGLSGAVFHVGGDFAGSTYDTNGIDVTINDSGIIDGLTGKLVTGQTYTFTETAPPQGYENHDLTFKISVSDEGSGSSFTVTEIKINNQTVSANSPDDLVIINSSDQEMIRVVNTPVEITLKKTDADDGTKTLAGAVFTLKPKPVEEGSTATNDFASLYKEGKTGPITNYHAATDTASAYITLTTGNDGTVAIPSAALVINNTYVLTETTAPPGYELAGEITFKVKADGSIETINRTDNTPGTGNVTLDDDKTIIQVTDKLIDASITKNGLVNGGTGNTWAGSGGSDKPLAGVTFTLQPDTGTSSTFANTLTSSAPDTNNTITLTTGTDGKIKIEKGILKQNNYYWLKETKTADNYYLSNSAKAGIKLYVDEYGQLTIVNSTTETDKKTKAPYTIKADAAITVTNPETTSFTIKKDVTGNMGDLNGSFALKVTVTEPDAVDGSKGTVINNNDDGIKTVTLKRGEEYNSLTDYPNGIPVGAIVEITEPKDSGYTAKVAGVNGQFGSGIATVTENVNGDKAKVRIVLNPDGKPVQVDIKLTNDKDVSIDVGVPDGAEAPLAMVAILIPVAWLVYRNRKKRKGGDY